MAPAEIKSEKAVQGDSNLFKLERYKKLISTLYNIHQSRIINVI